MLNQRVEALCFRLSKELVFKGQVQQPPTHPHLSTNFCFSPSTYWHHLNTTVHYYYSLGYSFSLIFCIGRKLWPVSNGYVFQAGLENRVGPKIEACRLKHGAERIILNKNSDHSHSLLCSACPEHKAQSLYHGAWGLSSLGPACLSCLTSQYLTLLHSSQSWSLPLGPPQFLNTIST